MSSRRSRWTREDKQGIAIIAACTMVALALAGTALTLRLMRLKLDEETLCPIDAPIPHHYLFLVDKTDNLTPHQASDLRSNLLSVKSQMDTNDRLTLAVITDVTDSEIDIVFSRCKPDDGKHATFLYQNPPLIQQKFEETFGAPLTSAIDELLNQDERPRSPLVGSIRKAADWPDFVSVAQRKLFVVSDFLQHTPPRYSEYESQNGATHPSIGREVLGGVEVHATRLMRVNLQQLQGDAHEQRWRRLFAESGAILTDGWFRDVD